MRPLVSAPHTQPSYTDTASHPVPFHTPTSTHPHPHIHLHTASAPHPHTTCSSLSPPFPHTHTHTHTHTHPHPNTLTASHPFLHSCTHNNNDVQAYVSHNHTHIPRVGRNHIYTYIYTVYLVISLPKILYIHRIYIYMVLASPTHTLTPTFTQPCIN